MRVLSSELFGDYPVYLDNWRVAYQGCNSWSGGSRGIYTADSRGSEPNRVHRRNLRSSFRESRLRDSV